MARSKITLYTFQYTKADLDKAPAQDRLFFLMTTGLANDIQMLNKTLAVIIDNESSESTEIEKQGNNSFAILILRMLCGRLSEGWKLLNHFMITLKSEYESDMTEVGRAGLCGLDTYFNLRKGKHSLISKIRNRVAFHSDQSLVEAAYNSLDPKTELGDYLHETIGNTLYFSAELLQFESLTKLMAGQPIDRALDQLWDEVQQQTKHFNDVIMSFASVFCERHLPNAKLADETDTIEVCQFGELNLRYFSELRPPKSET